MSRSALPRAADSGASRPAPRCPHFPRPPGALPVSAPSVPAPQRVLLVQPWIPSADLWLSMTRYSGRIAALLEPGVEVSSARASHVNMPLPLRRFFPSYRRFEPLPRRWRGQLDLVHFTDIYLGVHARRFDGARVTTVHDTMPAEYAGWFERGGARWRTAYLRSLHRLGRSDLVITPSEHTRRGLLESTRLAPELVRVVGIHVPDEIAAPPPGSVREPATILSVGTTAPYKNLPLLLHALARPELRGARLLRVGSPFDGELPALVRRLGLEERIEHLGGVSDERLLSLLQSSTVLAQPSLDEGFGMPAAEAMAAGLPVVCSNGGALPEVVGGAGRVVPFRKLTKGPPNLDDARDFAAALADVLGSPGVQQSMSEAGLREVSRYRAAPVREQLLRAYGSAMELARARSGA